MFKNLTLKVVFVDNFIFFVLSVENKILTVGTFQNNREHENIYATLVLGVVTLQP